MTSFLGMEPGRRQRAGVGSGRSGCGAVLFDCSTRELRSAFLFSLVGFEKRGWFVRSERVVKGHSSGGIRLWPAGGFRLIPGLRGLCG